MKFLILLLLPLLMHAQTRELAYPQTAFDADTCCWRKLSAAGQHEQAGQLIAAYIDHSPNVENKHSLHWHAGQMFASAQNTKQACRYFKKTYSVFYKWFGGDDGKAWYFYAKGTVAFVQRNRELLERIIQHWQSHNLEQDRNYRSLVQMLEHWDKPYMEAATVK